MTKQRRRGGSNNRNVFSPSSEGWEYKIKLPAESVFRESSFLGLRWPPSHCVLMWSLLCARVAGGREREREQASSGVSSKNIRPIRSGPHPMTLFNLHYFLIPNIATLGEGGVSASTCESEEDIDICTITVMFQPIQLINVFVTLRLSQALRDPWILFEPTE